MKDLARKWMILPPVLVGALALALALYLKERPEEDFIGEESWKARVIVVPSVDVVPRALGYGNVQPGAVWEAVAEVGGKIVEIHPQLKKGAILPEGAVLLRIDPTDYELAIVQIEAGIRGIQAQLAELNVREENTKVSLGIEERNLELGERDLERKRTLQKKKAVAQAAVDKEERNVLGLKLNVQNLKNTLNLIPAERDLLEAELALNWAQLEDARLDLARTTITAPFNCRISEVNVERAQYANQGKVLAVADGIDVAEVSAQLPIGKMMSLIAPDEEKVISAATIMSELPDFLGLTPIVRLRTDRMSLEWRGRLARISDTIDPRTRTVGVIVAVDDPYRQARPGVRPPLVKNMFVEVELRGRPRPGRVVVPRAAFHDGRVYVADAGNRLRAREVTVLFSQTNFIVIGSGLSAGERVVVSDLVPAIEGMLLDPVRDEEAERHLIAEARGEGTVQ